MPFDELSAYLKYATGIEEVARIPASVDPEYELAAVAHTVCRTHGGWSPVLVFENVQGSRFPVVANLLSSTTRFLKALEVDSFDSAITRVVSAFTPRFGPAESWLESFKMLPGPSETNRLIPKLLRSGLCQQIVKLGKDASLAELPIPHCWPGESGRCITAGIVHFTNLPATCRQFRLIPAEVTGDDTLLLHWTDQPQFQRMFREYLKSGRQMPCALSLGGDPLLTYVATLPLPHPPDPFLFAGLLRGENVNLVRGRSVELEIPAESEFIIEGYIDPVDPTGSGVVANSFGYLSQNDHLPVMRITGMTHRANPVFPALIRGPAPCEEHAFAQLTERLLLPVARLLDADIVDVHLPLAGCAGRIVFVALQKSTPMQGRRVMNLLWGLPILAEAKMVVIVDGNVDLREPDLVWQQVASQAHPQRDVVLQEGTADMNDHAAPVRGLGSKIGIDATTKSAAEGHPRQWWPAARISDELAVHLRNKWPEFGLGDWENT